VWLVVLSLGVIARHVSLPGACRVRMDSLLVGNAGLARKALTRMIINARLALLFANPVLTQQLANHA